MIGEALVFDIEDGLSKYPGLRIEYDSGKVQVRGTIPLAFKGVEYENFEILIQYTDNYPNEYPRVWELRNKIPREADRHVNPDGSFCLNIPAKEHLHCKWGITTSFFLEKILYPYLVNQFLINEKVVDKFKSGEYNHGRSGMRQFYEELLETKDWKIILKAFKIVVNFEILSSWEPCFCGKGNPYLFCHYSAMNTMKILGKNYLQNEWYYISSSL